MKKLRRWLSISLIISIAFLLPMSAVAEAAPAQIDFVASNTDANNNFTVTMSIRNATFNVMQFVLRYDVTKIQPIDSNTKMATTNFSQFAVVNSQLVDSFTITHDKLDTDLGLIDFTQYILGSSYSYYAERIENAANIGSTPMRIFVFHFKLLNNDTPMFELAKEDPVKNYRDYLPNGGGLAYAGVQISAVTNIDLTLLQGKIIEEEYHNPTPTPIIPPVAPSEPIIDGQTPIRPKTATERLVNTLVMQIGNYAAAEDGALCHIYPNEKEVVPYIRDNRTFVPIRFIAEKLGMNVSWDEAGRTVTFSKEDEILKLTIGEYHYERNGIDFSMDTAAEIQWNRTMVPVRFVAEALGFAVEWNPIQKMVFITEIAFPWLLEDPIEEQATNDVAFIISPLIRDFV